MHRAWLVIAVVGVAAIARADQAYVRGPAPQSLPGWALYDRFCVACHGAAGDGGGPAAPWLEPRPRDLTRGAYRWRTVDVGVPATRDDLASTIRWGAPGTSMPGFGATLSATQIDALIDVVAGFAPDVLVARSTTRGHAVFSAPAAAKGARGAELWARYGCAKCHGDAMRGDGPAAASLHDSAGEPLPPYDLSAEPLRRPRPTDDPADVDRALADSIRYGLDGTAMPGYASLDAGELGELVAYVDGFRRKVPAPGNAGPLSDRAIAMDRDAQPRMAPGHWPGRGAPDEAALFGGAIDPQGAAPASLAPAEASLSELQCARCHAKQAREWTGTIHAQATAPGVVAQLPAMTAQGARDCQRCHAPLAEQQAPSDEPLRAQGVTCAACHVRGWRRHGPPRVSPTLLAIPGYPLDEQPIYERGDFCMACHQLPARLAIAGRPLLDTYREWLEGPYMRRGVQCQSCHMPDREHTWKGIHDPDTFRQGIRVEAIVGRGASGAVSVRARVWNQGAGHFLPTTPTPAAWLRIELIDRDGNVVRGATADKRIGRAIAFANGAFTQLEDTRIPPGDNLELAAAWAGGRVADAVAARITVEVHPDDYYEGFYRTRLAAAPDAAARALYEAALARALASHYVAYRGDVPLR